MCVVSFVGDSWRPGSMPDTWQWGGIAQSAQSTIVAPPVTRAEFDALKSEFENLVKLLKLAKVIDEQMGAPDCEMEDKVARIKAFTERMYELATEYDVDLSDALAGVAEVFS